jgi:hypothetical protein
LYSWHGGSGNPNKFPLPFSFSETMSILTDFAKSMFTQSASIIGTENVVVAGHTLACVLAEQSSDLTFDDGRNEREKRITAVLRGDALPSDVRENALATCRGEEWRIDSIDNRGGTFATLMLTTETRA